MINKKIDYKPIVYTILNQMIELVYYSPELRVYRDGRVERYYKNEWKFCNIKPHTSGYIHIKINKRKLKLHRIIAYCFLGLESMSFHKTNEIDHKNRIKHDNRVDNLRIVSRNLNMQNNNRKGYCWCNRDKKFITRISVNKKTITVGRFDTEEEARQAYQTAKAKYHVIAI